MLFAFYAKPYPVGRELVEGNHSVVPNRDI